MLTRWQRSDTLWPVVSPGEIDQAGGTPSAQRSRQHYLLRFVGYLVVGVLSLLTALTLMTVTDTFSGGPDAAATGTAQVRQCTEMGPVSLAGLGYFHRCEADVAWDDGSTSREWFPAGQLSPDDRGQAVPVFTPELPEETGTRGGPLSTEPGVNDSAKWVSVGIIGAMVLGLIGAIALLVAVFVAYRVVRPGPRTLGAGEPGRWPTNRRMSRRRRGSDDWPVTDADLAAVPRFRREVRVRLLSAVVLAGILLHLYASIPRNDAPRAVDFVTPWPEIARAWLVGPADPSTVVDFGVALVGAGIAALVGSMAAGIRGSSAEVARYGLPCVMQQSGWSRKQADKELRRMASGRRSAYQRGVAFAAVVLAIAGYAAVRAFVELPADAPLAVMIAGLRDAIVLALLGLTLLVTVEPPYDRLRALLSVHEEREREGTDLGVAQS